MNLEMKKYVELRSETNINVFCFFLQQNQTYVSENGDSIVTLIKNTDLEDIEHDNEFRLVVFVFRF